MITQQSKHRQYYYFLHNFNGIWVFKSIGSDVPCVAWTVFEVPNGNLVSILAASSLNAQGQAVMGRSDGKTSIHSLNFPLLIDRSVWLAHVALSSRLGCGVVGDFKSSSEFTVNDAEVALAVRSESPFLVAIAMAWPDDELATLMRISTGIH